MTTRWDDDHTPAEPGEPDDELNDPEGVGGHE